MNRHRTSVGAGARSPLPPALRIVGATLIALSGLSAHAAVNQFVIGMVSSGTAPFDATSGPGLDASVGDSVVRTNDRFSYRVGYSLAPADEQRLVTLSMGATTLPGGYTGPALTPSDIAYFSVADLPTGANGCSNISATPVAWPPAANTTTSGVSADGQHIVCYQGSNASGANMDFVARIGGAVPNGTTVAPPVPTFQSASNTSGYTPTPLTGVFGGTALYGTPTLTVSAAPRWKVQKTVAPGGGVLIPGSGPMGQDGYIVGFNIGVYAAGSRKGLEALRPDFTIAENFNDPDMPGARLVDWNVNVPGFANLPMGAGTEPANQNGCGDWRSQLARVGNQYDNLFYFPADYGATGSSATTAVRNGGTCSATGVSVAAKTATLAFSGTDFSLRTYPQTRGTGGGRLVSSTDEDAATNEWWVASKSVLIWVPVDDLTPNVNEILTNNAALSGTSVTGQANPASNASADGTFLRTAGGSFSKIYSTAQTWQASAMPDPTLLAACDPNVAGDCWVNQVAPGQILAARLSTSVNSDGFLNGHICEKIDNSRFTFVDFRAVPAAANAVVDSNTGVATRYLAGNATTAPLVFELGVGGTGITGGTWTTRSNVTTEYHSPQPKTNEGTQATADCLDGDATWYPSIDALVAAGRTLSEVTRVRAKYSTYPAATRTLLYVPLQVNATYAYSATETDGTTPTLSPGTSTVDSYAPNQALWLPTTTLGTVPRRSSDALRIMQTEYARIAKRALPPHGINNGSVSRGSVVDYGLTVNLTSSTNAHTAATVEIWDVLPPNLDVVPGSARFSGAAVAGTCWPKGVTPPAPSPFEAGSVGPNYQACRWTLTNQPVAKAAAGAAAGNLPELTFQAIVSATVPPGTNLLNTSFADSTGNLLRDAVYPVTTAGAPVGFACPSGVTTCSFGNWNLVVSSDTGIVLNKAVSTPEVPQNTGFTYTLQYSAIGTTLSNVRVLDVLPATSDGRSSAYAGTVALTGAIPAPVASAGPPAVSADPGMVVRYTANAPAQINRDPMHAGHNIAGTGTNSATSTNWCTAAQIAASAANCPASFAAVTAFMAFPRETDGGVIPAGTMYQLQVAVQPNGNAIGDTYLNDFVADSASLTARRPGSNTVLTTVIGTAQPGQTVSGRVYREASAPANTSDDGDAVDPGFSGVTVRLVCASPAYDQTTTTAADGSYSFSGVTSGAVCTLTETQPAGFTNAYNTPGTGGTGQTGDSGAGDSTISLTVPVGGSTGNNFAETYNGPMDADMVSTTVCTPSTAAEGATVSCTVTCRNQGPSPAVGAICTVPNASALPGAPTPACSPSGTVAVNGLLTCTVSFTMPTPGAQISVQGGTGAVNDSNGGNNPAGGNNPSTARVDPQLQAVPTLDKLALLLLALVMGAMAVRRRYIV